MSPIQAITTCLRKSFQFSGRASRSEYWWFLPIGIVVPFTALWFLASLRPDTSTFALGSTFFLTLSPLMAVTKRRLNDAGSPSTWFETPLMALAFFLAALWASVSLTNWAFGAWENGADGPAGFGVMIFWGLGHLVLIPVILQQFFVGLITGSALFSQMASPSRSATKSHGPTLSKDKS